MKAGARILPTIEAVYRECDMIVKVKEPIEPEYELVRPGQLLFTYFHFACEKELTEAMLKSKAVCLAYETVQLPNGSLPLLQPMSEVAGRMATLNGAYYLQKTKGGKGWQQACKDDSALAKGLNIVEGKVTYKAVTDVFNLPYEPI